MDPSARPQFYDGQYIGADDLAAIGDYAAARLREHLLAGHTWGIGAGLEIVEQQNPDGSVDAWVQAGYGHDGYGRAMTVRAPVPVTLAPLQGLPSGAWYVWLAYHETGQRAAREAYGVCEGLEIYLRVMEQCELRIGGNLPADQRIGGIAFGGATRPDPRLARRVFDPAGPFLPDGSVPDQGAPPVGAKSPWLLPLGLVGWDAASGRLRPLSAPERMGARLLRRYAGAVAESLLAPDGLLRLRSRLAPADGAPDSAVDKISALNALTMADLRVEAGRVLPNDLVWIEGHLRTYGDARLFGGRLELRAADGSEPLGPFSIGRAGADPGQQHLDIALGNSAGAGQQNRLLVGPADGPGGALQAVLTVQANGRVGVGTGSPQLTLDIKGDFGRDDGPAAVHLKQSRIGDAGDGKLVVKAGSSSIVLGEADHHVGINTSKPSGAFALEIKGGLGVTGTPAALSLLGSEVRDDGDGVLRIRSGGGTVAFDGGDRIGIGTDAPAPDLALDVHGGIGCSSGPAFVRLRGSVLSDGNDGILRIRSGGASVAFDGGDRVGIGTAAPAATLDVAGDAQFSGDAQFGGDVTVNGNLYSSGPFWPPSDARMKERIAPIEDALGALLKLRGVHYVWRPQFHKDARPQVGMLADEVEAVFPQWVQAGPDGYKRMSAQGFEGLAVEAIRELDRRLAQSEALAARVEALEQRIRQLEAAAPAKTARKTKPRST
ncbi:tail fiber domain-containing protein [Massilia sp. BJB1822]|uniref:tail fiber domain-containing protein n=1 Tax=Massilia sp. BJB1822 TaxID=2744470 RepID=UPI0015949A6E|nr:tail fiber domain-containing protein [Massilia sp. BJB1822]NVD97977.1 tail fiber domain-containing protein [Massilia sp. BJB1822]